MSSHVSEIYYHPNVDYDKEASNPVKEQKSGYFEAICNIFKSQVGATMLAIPYTMSLCGIGYGIIIQICTSMLMLYGVGKLVKIADEVQRPKLYYPELVEQILGHKAGSAIGMILSSLSIGSCISYLIFFQQFISEAFRYAGTIASQWEIIIITLLILTPFVFITNFHFLTKSSAFAMGLMLFTIGYVINYDFQILSQGYTPNHEVTFFNFSQIPSYLGVAIFATEGIPCVFHIRDSMEKPRNFMKLFYLAVFLLFFIYMTFAVINIFTYEEYLNQIVLMNVPYTTMASFFAKIGFATAILLTYPVQIFPVYSMLEKSVLSIQKNASIEDLSKIQVYKIYGIRLAVLASIMMVAYAIPQFAGILNVLGCISGIISQFIYPLIMDNVYHGEAKNKFVRYFDNSLIVFSSFLTVICGYISIKDLLSQLN